MSRVFRPEPAARTRRKLLQHIAHALHFSAEARVEEAEQRDLLAFILLACNQIAASVDETATAWERRGYWIKADRFRMEWNWLEVVRAALAASLGASDLPQAAAHAVTIVGHMGEIRAPRRFQPPRPWEGAWERWKGEQE